MSVRDNPVRAAKTATITFGVIGVIAAIVWGIIFASMNWQRGIYAGTHGHDARNMVMSQMALDYGSDAFQSMEYAGSAKTHIGGDLGPQERVYYFTDPQGVKYCGYEWQTDGDHFIVSTKKGCEFK